jgi:Holliday junction resolvasome RuvABC endonuclease subunit
LDAQLGRAQDTAAQVRGSAVELSSLGASFSHGVQVFSASNEKLMDTLQRVEAAIGKSMVRSDEQLAYYVAQAREVIDLSIASQQGIVEDLRRLDGRKAALAAGGT